MNKLFGLFLLALAFLAPASANAACAGNQCFWIGGTGTVDGTLDNGHWSLTTGGASCACVPATTDNVNFDASSAGGTVTINMAGANWTVASLTASGFTGTLQFATNSNGLTTPGSVIANSGSATFTMGSGTFTLSGASSFWNVSGASVTVTAGTSTVAFTATTGTGFRRLSVGTGKTLNNVTFAANPNNLTSFTSSGTITTLTIAAPQILNFPGGSTVTVTNFTDITGTSSTPVLFSPGDITAGKAIISSANNWTCTWCGFTNMQFQGGGTFTGNSSLNFGNNSGITINVPSAGGGVPKFIGG
jgi:hypothetical protein